jgi:putative transcriptional regulator
MRVHPRRQPIQNLDRRAQLRSLLLADAVTTSQWSEARVDAMAAQDDNTWTDDDLANAVKVYPPPTPDQVRALRARLQLSQAQFALQFGFTIDTAQQYEQGRCKPSGPTYTLLRVIEVDPEAVIRALQRR